MNLARPDPNSKRRRAAQNLLDDPMLSIRGAARQVDVNPQALREILERAGAVITCPCCGDAVPRGQMKPEALAKLGITLEQLAEPLRKLVEENHDRSNRRV
jgi:hypothetical protein